MIMPQHHNRCHPFVGRSFLSPSRVDDSEDSASDDESGGSDVEADDEGCNKRSSPAADTQGSDDDGDVPGDRATQRRKVQLNNRRAGFVIDDNADAGLTAVFARKEIRTGCPGQRRKQVTAVVVRERGTVKNSRIVQFLYAVPSAMSAAFETWVAVPHSDHRDSNLLFGRKGQVNTQRPVEETISARCRGLTRAQRCADWFILHQFRVTGTSAGQILLQDAGHVNG